MEKKKNKNLQLVSCMVDRSVQYKSGIKRIDLTLFSVCSDIDGRMHYVLPYKHTLTTRTGKFDGIAEGNIIYYMQDMSNPELTPFGRLNGRFARFATKSEIVEALI